MSKDFVQIRIEEERKQRWGEAVDEGGAYRSMTHLIVTAVENELHDGNGSEAVGDVDLGEMHERFDSVMHRIREIEETVDETNAMVRRDEFSNYTNLKGRIQDLIPTGKRDEIVRLEPSDRPGETDEGELEAVVSRTGSADHLVRLLMMEGYSLVEARGAIEQLADDVEGIELEFAKPAEQSDKRIYRVSR